MVDTNIESNRANHAIVEDPAPGVASKWCSDPFDGQETCRIRDHSGHWFDRIAVCGDDASAGLVTNAKIQYDGNSDLFNVCTSNHAVLEAQVNMS